MIVLDTTVLVYAVGAEHPLRDACRNLLQLVGDGALRATTTVEVVQEFAHVRGRRRGRNDAKALAARYVDLFAPLLETKTAHLQVGLELWTRHPPLGCFDAVLAAVAQAAGSGVIVSADAGFAAVEGIVHVLPDAAGIDQLIQN